MTQVFLLTGASSFADPGNWNPVNTVEVVGCGYQGQRGRTNPPCPVYVPGPGGSGGGYGRGSNRVEPFPVALLICAGNVPSLTGGTAYYSNWGDPGGGGTSGNQTRGAVYAGNAAGASGSTSVGYAGVAGGPDVGYAGGRGGSTDLTTTHYSGGGAGAGGPHGAGANGANGSASVTAGGASDAGTVAGATTAGAAGLSGTQWDPSHGTGSGGAGVTGAAAGGRGGQYGGGAAGGGNTNTAVTTGGDAIIVVTYTPYVPPPQVFANMMV